MFDHQQGCSLGKPGTTMRHAAFSCHPLSPETHRARTHLSDLALYGVESIPLSKTVRSLSSNP